MAQRRLRLNEDQRAFATTLFELYPTFLPTRALYVDLEGSGHGVESIVSLFWPQNNRDQRFKWIVRRPESKIDISDLVEACEKLGLQPPQPQWVVTYAQGRYCSQERDRLVELLEMDPWPDAVWVNLLHPFQDSREMTAAIRRHRYVKYRSDRTRIRRSLESLEWEFGIKRNPAIRSRSNEYSDGLAGEMAVLDRARELVNGTIARADQQKLYRYCKQDVLSMHRIARDCERGLFGPSARGRRYAEHDTLAQYAGPSTSNRRTDRQITDDARSDPELIVFDYCPWCGHKFLKVNKHGKPFSPRQRNAQFKAHKKKFHAELS